jgi:DNA-binding NarL/FixJ family response regulator
MDLIKVVIADDHVLFREGLKRVMAVEKDILVVGEAANTAEAIDVVARTRPDILLLDLKMPKGDPVESLFKFTETSPATQVMILTAFSEKENVLTTARRRARGYILKGIAVPTLIQAIRKVKEGDVWVDPELPGGDDFARIAKSIPPEFGPPANHAIGSLTPRELEILRLVAAGLSNEEIGKRILISQKTVKTHLTNIFNKLQVNNRIKAALLVMPNRKTSGVAK